MKGKALSLVLLMLMFVVGPFVLGFGLMLLLNPPSREAPHEQP